MPWKETHVNEQRRRFVEEYFDRRCVWKMTELCEAFGVSRKTGYKWIDRFQRRGMEGLIDQSRARHTQEGATDPAIVEALVEVRKKHPSWGPRKLVGYLERRKPGVSWPALSTVGDILKRQGLVEPRRRRRRGVGIDAPGWREATHPNAVWGVDFKGWFRTKDGVRCDPLTISDLYSRYLLKCQGVERPNGRYTKLVFERVFAEYGLPLAIRSDNGPPFASRGVGGLTKLAAWWVKLGIELDRIAPGCPEQNGRHERMHQTLKQDTAMPPAASARAQQRRFNRFQRTYNCERPHEALGDDCPAEHYQSSPRPYPRKLAELEYPAHFLVRKVRTSGEIKWAGELIYLSEALVREPVGCEQVDDRKWRVYFGPIALAWLDSHTHRLLPFRVWGRQRNRSPRPAVDDSGRPTGSLRHPQLQDKEGTH